MRSGLPPDRECLDGERLEYEELWERGVIATRQLARRQLTWLRAESDTVWFDSLERPR